MNEGRSFWNLPEEWLMLLMAKVIQGTAYTLDAYGRLTSVKRTGDKEERILQSIQYWAFGLPIARPYRRWRTTGKFRRSDR